MCLCNSDFQRFIDSIEMKVNVTKRCYLNFDANLHFFSEKTAMFCGKNLVFSKKNTKKHYF